MMAVRTAVLPVAGRGTRFLPVTKAVPKEVLPLVDRPCIEYIVAEAVQAGIDRIIFVTAEGKDALVHYFQTHPGLEAYLTDTGKTELLREVRRVSQMAEVIPVRQDQALGLGHAVLQAHQAVGNEPFAVMLGDDVIDAEVPAIAQLMQGYTEGEAVVALMEVPREDTRRYGVCAGEMTAHNRMRVSQMVEKPDPADAPSNFAIVGRYILPADIWGMLASTQAGAGGEIQLTDAIAQLAPQDRVAGHVFDGDRFDTGNVIGLVRATLHFALKRPDLAGPLRDVLKEFEGR